MKQFKTLLGEINYTIGFFMLFEEILSSAIVFLVLYLILYFFNYPPLAASGPAIAYFIFFTYQKMKKDRSRIIESKYDALREKLRTARDNANSENPIVEELEKEVIDSMRSVRVSSFVDTKNISLKVVGSMVLCFIIVAMAILDVSLASLSSSDTAEKLFNRTILRGRNDLTVELNISEDIYGKDSVAKLGNEELSIKIKPANYKVNVREGGDVERRQFDETFPTQAFVESATVYEENIPKEQQELVKKYFEKLKES